MRTNFNAFRRKVSKTFENERYFEPNEFSSKFRCFFETAIVLPFAKNCTNPRKVRRNFERHFADSIEFSQLNSKRASKFRRLFRKVLKKFADCFEIPKCLWPEDHDCCVTLYWDAIRWCVLMQIYYTHRGQLQLSLNGKILCFWRPNL